MILTELTVKSSQRHQISILDPHQVVPNPSPKVVMSMLHLANMTMAKSLVMMPRASRFLKRDSRESLRLWVLEPMILTELTVKHSLKFQILILDPHRVALNPSPKVEMLM